MHHLTWMLLLFMSISFVSSQCPPNTFKCADGSCIPSDWKGDGEKDCEDGSDEDSTSDSTTTDFDEEISTTSMKSTVVSGSSDEDCDWAQQQRVDNCSEPIIRFLHDIDRLNLKNMSFLTSADIQSQIESGCSLMQAYHECTSGVDQKCRPDEGVHSWAEVEMFMCQLVLPSVREHLECFKSSADSRCDASKTSDSSTLCSLVTSIQASTSCLETIRPETCSSDAIEMLSPIREETQQIISSIRCVTSEPTTVMVIDETTESSSSSQASESIEESTEDNDDNLTTQSTTSRTDSEDDANKPALTINLADAVNSLYYIYDICSSNYASDPFAKVADKICAKQDEIAKWSDCYQKTLEKQKCAIRNATTTCDALTSYNNNLDCAIVTMNDECEVDAQNLVVELQEEVNDLIIASKCFEEPKTTTAAPKPGDFRLETTLPKCSEEQENGALGCLVELVEINKKMTQFANLNFLLEIASPNSTVVAGICDLFARYEQCLDATVFKTRGERCSFASPLNSLARIGLAPICSLDSRPMLAKHRECFEILQSQTMDETANCQSGLASLSSAVSMMLQGVHGEALLCKSFYTIRGTFECGEKAVKDKCEPQALKDLLALKEKVTSLGLEEGCPAIEPSNLDEIISRPVARPTPVTLPPSSAPSARPLPLPTTTAHPLPTASKCSTDDQKRFEECVKPLTAFQPHPLSVIAVPRDIDRACEAFHTFKACSAASQCHPLWAKGMSAMFEFACDEAAAQFKVSRKCIREASQHDEVRACVAEFSRGAPTAACISSNKLSQCAVPHVRSKCGDDAAEWVSSYIIRFANAIDARCRVGRQLPVGKVIGIGCSPEEESIIDHCAAPLNDIGARVEELFAGGMQSLIKNINALAPVFAGGCNLTAEFRQCAHFLLEGKTTCVVSSCMIEAGRDVCALPDPTKAIDDNLSCLFGQAQEPKFAQCIRTTISTLKTFNLSTLRNVLPKFIDCTKDIVMNKCGESPIRILRAMSTPDICPVHAKIQPVNFVAVTPTTTTTLDTILSSTTTTTEVSTTIGVVEEKAEEKEIVEDGKCGEADLVEHLQCETHLDQFAFRPISIIGDGTKWDEFCTMINTTYLPCVDKLKCKFEPASNAQVTLIDSICNRQITLRDQKQFARCLSDYTKTDEGTACLSNTIGHIDQLDKSAPAMMCQGINRLMQCSSQSIERKCGFDALLHVFSLHNQWANLFNATCILESPEPAKPITSLDTNEVEPSRDTKPETVQIDETTPKTSVVEESNDVTEADTVPSTTTVITASSSRKMMVLSIFAAILLTF